MSVRFNLKDITDTKIINDINTLLTITAREDEGNFMQKKYSKHKNVKMYIVENDILHVPYRFACSYFKKIFAMNKEYQKLNPNLNFIGEPREYQKEVIKEATNDLNKYNTCTLALFPGFGKTFIGIMLAFSKKLKTVILIHRENFIKQNIKTIHKNIPNAKIWVVGEEYVENADFVICMDQRVDKIKDIHTYGTLIIDEAHCFCTQSRIRPMLLFSPRYIIIQTATPDKSDGMFDMVKTIAGNHFLRKMSNKPYHCIIIDTELNFEIETDDNKFGELKRLQSISDERNQLILDLVLFNSEKKIMIINSLKEHCRFITDEINKHEDCASSYYGNMKGYKGKRVLVGSMSKMGVGFDEENFNEDFERASDILVITTTFATFEPFEQVRGRGMRTEKPIIIYLNDKNRITRRHINTMKKWIKETNGTIVNMNINDTRRNVDDILKDI